MDKEFFRTLYSPPRYLQMPSVGLDISDKSVRFLGLANENSVCAVRAHAEEKLESNVVVQGKIKDERRIKETLAALRGDHGLEFVRVSLPEEQAYLFRMGLPKISKREIKESISFQIEEHVPLKAPDTVFDYQIISETSQGYAVQVSAIPRQLAESYANLFIQSGLVPLSFEIEAQAIARAVVPRGDKGTYMVVDFGQMRSGISIVSEGVVAFTSTVEIGGSMITDAIAKEFNIAREEAELLKKEKGLIREKKNETKEVFPVVLNSIAPLRDEINKHFIYWHTHKDEHQAQNRKVQKIFLCGGDSNLRGFPDYLARSMRIPVVLGNVWVNTADFNRYIPPIPFNESLKYATAIGLALRDTQHDD